MDKDDLYYDWLADQFHFNNIFMEKKPSIGQILKAIRILCGYEQKEVAHAIGAKQGAISKWELNLNLPSAEFIVPLAELYCLDIENFLTLLGYKEVKKSN